MHSRSRLTLVSQFSPTEVTGQACEWTWGIREVPGAEGVQLGVPLGRQPSAERNWGQFQGVMSNLLLSTREAKSRVEPLRGGMERASSANHNSHDANETVHFQARCKGQEPMSVCPPSSVTSASTTDIGVFSLNFLFAGVIFKLGAFAYLFALRSAGMPWRVGGDRTPPWALAFHLL